MAAIRAQHGNDAVAIYAGNPTVHNLGAMLGVGDFIRAFRTQQPVFGHQRRPVAAHGGVLGDVRPPVPDAGAGRRSHAAVRLHRRQPGGLRRLDHGRARLREAHRCAACARRPLRRRRPAPHRIRGDRRRVPRAFVPAPTSTCCSHCCTRCSRRAAPTWPTSRRTSTDSTVLRAAVLQFDPAATRRPHEPAALADRRAGPRAARRAAGPRLRSRRRVHAGVRRPHAVADLLPQCASPATSTARAA